MVSKIYKSTLNGFILLQGIELWKNTSSEEIYSMVYESEASLRDQAIILYTSGLRNSMLRALHYGDIKEGIRSKSSTFAY
jgi:site-specific recombinase XerC